MTYNFQWGTWAKQTARQVSGALSRVRSRLLAATGRGRWIRRRLGRLFDLAAGLGLDALVDFMAHRPWLARGRPAGRPRA
jgi:hypothetical protein